MSEQRAGDIHFEEGAVVRLKSGGPPMSVRWQDPDGDAVHVAWFFRGKSGGGVYRPGMLERCAGSEAIALGVPDKSGPKPFAQPAQE